MTKRSVAARRANRRGGLESPLEARTLGEFVAHVETFKEALWDKWGVRVDPWFRGVSNASHSLIPGAYRVQSASFDEDDYRLEFQLRAFPYLSEVPVSPRSGWDWYFLMQHYGLPTRLLDWSEASFVSLFFALRERQEADCAVWMLDPFKFNAALHRVDIVPNATDALVRRYLADPYERSSMPAAPMAIQPPFHSRRIFAQKGMFTVHGRARQGLEEYGKLKGHLRKVIVPQSASWRIRDELATAGISETTLFPELSSLSRDLIALYADAPPSALNTATGVAAVRQMRGRPSGAKPLKAAGSSPVRRHGRATKKG